MGCSKRNGGNTNCCIQTIRATGKSCANNSPPCVIYGDQANAPPCKGCDKSPKVNGRGVVTQMAAAPTQMAIGVPEGVYKCIDKYHRCTDTWCNDNCNHAGAAFCPASYCRKI